MKTGTKYENIIKVYNLLKLIVFFFMTSYLVNQYILTVYMNFCLVKLLALSVSFYDQDPHLCCM